MSERTPAPTADPDAWDAVLARLRLDGFSPAQSIQVTRAVLHVSLGDAKAIVHQSRAWTDVRGGFDELHESAEATAVQLASVPHPNASEA